MPENVAPELVALGEIPSVQIGSSRRLPAERFREYAESL
jgi:hypothetical protein